MKRAGRPGTEPRATEKRSRGTGATPEKQGPAKAFPVPSESDRAGSPAPLPRRSLSAVTIPAQCCAGARGAGNSSWAPDEAEPTHISHRSWAHLKPDALLGTAGMRL